MRITNRGRCCGPSRRGLYLLGHLILAGLFAGNVDCAFCQATGTITFVSGTTGNVNYNSQLNTVGNSLALAFTIANNGSKTQLVTGTFPTTMRWNSPITDNNGYTGGYQQPTDFQATMASTGAPFTSDNVATFSATVLAGASVTVTRYYSASLKVNRSQHNIPNPYAMYFYIPSASSTQAATTFTSHAPFLVTYLVGSDTKTASFDTTFRVTFNSGAAAYLVHTASLALTLNLGGNPAVAATSGKGTFVLNMRGKQSAGCTVKLKIRADAARGLAAVEQTAGTTIAGSTDADNTQFSLALDNPTGGLNNRQFVWEVRNADGVLVASIYGRSPQWDGTVHTVDGLEVPDYTFVVNSRLSMVGRNAATSPIVGEAPSSTANGYNPATSPNPAGTAITKKDNYESTAKALSDVLGTKGAVGDAPSTDFGGDETEGTGLGDKIGFMNGDGWGLGPNTGSVASTGYSPTYSLSGFATLDLRANGWVSTIRTVLVAILGLVFFIQGAKVVRGASA